MDKSVLMLVQTLIQNDPNNPVIDLSIIPHYQDLISNDDFYLLPKEYLFRWAKMSKNLSPEKARILFQRMQRKFGMEALNLLEFLTIEPQDANSCALALSGLENCPLCKNVFDEGNCIILDNEDVIRQLKEENAKLHQQLKEYGEAKEKLIIDLTNQLSHSNEQYIQADNFVKSLQKEKKNLENELKKVNEIAEKATSDIKKLQDAHESLKASHNKCEADLEKSIFEAKRLQELLNDKNNRGINPSVSRLHQTTRSFPFKSSLFEGILHGLSLLKNSILDDYVILTASSSLDSSCIPSNVLENDASYWYSWCDGKTVLKPNEWIQFDFKGNKVAINAYAFKVDRSPKSWKIEGSNDNKSFTIIHNMALNEDFKECKDGKEKLYTLDQVSDMFRYIRITQGDDGNWNDSNDPTGKHIFSFYRIELFGYFQQ